MLFKQTLWRTAPRVRHPEQADRWTWLVLAAYAQSGLARSCAEDRRLPWKRPQRDRRLTPCRAKRYPPTGVEEGSPGLHKCSD